MSNSNKKLFNSTSYEKDELKIQYTSPSSIIQLATDNDVASLNLSKRYHIISSDNDEYKVNKEMLHRIKNTDPEKNIISKEKKKKKKNTSNFSISTYLMEKFTFKVFEKILFVWDDNKGYYVPLPVSEYDTFIRKNIPDYLKHTVNSYSIKEAAKWIKTESIKAQKEVNLSKRKDYIGFKNGVYDLLKGKLRESSPKFNLASIINANYTESAYGHVFRRFLDDICQGDSNLQNRIQEIFGYVISEKRDLKVIPYFIGPKDSGKSLILKLLEYLIGADFCTSLSMEELNRTEFLYQLIGKKLNTCAETSELTIKKLDTLKKISGGDRLMSKALYDQPISFINTAALVFAGNHLPIAHNLDRSNAFSERLLIVPLENKVAKDKQDPLLFDKLSKEVDYIACWALEGLKRLIENNFQFTETKKSLSLSDEFSAQNNSIEYFIKNNCTYNVNFKIYSADIENAYNEFCEFSNIIPSSKIELHRYLKTQNNLVYKRFRYNGENKNGYIGIALNENTNTEEESYE